MIQSVEKPLTVVDPKDFVSTGHAEFCLLGRSNVGKSSFINALLNRKNIAYTSQNPGKTQTLNFYLINDLFYLVDVPGYGYARRSKTQRRAFGRMIESYLANRDALKHVFLLIDSRHDPTKDDHLMVEFLQYLNVPFTIVATKADKLSNNQQNAHMERLKKLLMLDEYTSIVMFSAVTKQNRDLILENLMRFAREDA